MDGVTIGHPCCAVHDCTVPLASPKHRFCPSHKDHAIKCAVVSCKDSIESGFRTCALPDHRKVEDYLNIKNKAMFQLKHRLARLKVMQPSDALANDPNDEAANLHDDEEEELDVAIDKAGGPQECDGKSEEGNRKLRVRFGRRRTHNEQLCVASCGVIRGRATFFGSEALNGVRVCKVPLFLFTFSSISSRLFS